MSAEMSSPAKRPSSSIVGQLSGPRAKLKGQQKLSSQSGRKSPINQWTRQCATVIWCLLCLFSSCCLHHQPSFAQDIQIQSRPSSTHLSSYNQLASSSSFGEPIFRLEPPSVIKFANWQGAIIPCLASGSPRPTITWFSSAAATSGSYLDQARYLQPGSGAVGGGGGDTTLTKLVANVTNLRHIINNGAALRLLPFEENDFQPELHHTEYRCVASNELTSIHSKSVLVQAVVMARPPSSSLQEQANSLKVSDEFVALGGPATLRCQPAGGASGRHQTGLDLNYQLEWFTSDGLRIVADELLPQQSGTKAGPNWRWAKFVAFRTGELHVNELEMSDLQRTYGCRLRHLVSGQQVASSSGLAQLILTERSRAGTQVLHSINQLVVSESSLDAHTILLPCAVKITARSDQLRLRWMVQSGQQPMVGLEQWASERGAQVLSNPSQNFSRNRAPSSRPTTFYLGPSFLAIENPRRAISGRYVAQIEGSPVCDITVIISQPLKLSLDLISATTMSPSSAARVNHQYDRQERENWLSRATSWLLGDQHRRRRASIFEQELGNQLQLPAAVRVRSRGHIKPAPLIQVGQRLQLNCWLRSGYPVDSIRWLRNGQPINTQSASDFQVEILNHIADANQANPNDQAVLLGSLVVPQLQPSDSGSIMWECIASNSLGDSARAGQLVLVAERNQMDLARSLCSVPPGGNKQLDSDEEVAEESTLARLLFGQSNPYLSAVLLEQDSAELSCQDLVSRLGTDEGRQFEWSRISDAHDTWQSAPEVAPNRASSTRASQTQAAGQLDQLFTNGDSRFVINGSSLQIRSPSKRHDEALYVCRLAPAPQTNIEPGGRRLSDEEQQVGRSRPAAPSSSSKFELDNKEPQAVHQSLLASSLSSKRWPATSCGSALLAIEPNEARFVSSISIRIVAKPKIDPFEFSRNLEEGMRTVVVCAVVSGQTPIDITWFKDGNLLVPDQPEYMTVDQANSFSSTLTLHQIRATHSGLYTCVAANAFAATNHSSRLMVNVAPYFIDPPKSAQALLNSNVLINCLAGGQPRWRKLVVLPDSGRGQLAPPNGLGSDVDFMFGQVSPLTQATGSLSNRQVAGQLSSNKLEYRIVTSNSHIQVLENGSMVIKGVELADSSRYACQAFNGINPSLSEVIELQVLSPAQFDINYETVSVKRDSVIKFNCAPRGDLPMQIEWRKEGNLLVPAGNLIVSNDHGDSKPQVPAKYSELAHIVNLTSAGEHSTRQRHSNLVLSQSHQKSSTSNSTMNLDGSSSVKSSELMINFADRVDTGTYNCIAKNLYGSDQLTYRLIVQEVPDTPLDVKIQELKSTSLRLSWAAPFDGNLPITNFIIEHRKVSSGGQQSYQAFGPHGEWVRLVVSSSKLQQEELIDSGQANQVGYVIPLGGSTSTFNSTPGALSSSSTYSWTIRQLSPRSTYHLRVAAANAIGQGGFSSHLSATTAEEPPNSPVNDLRSQPVASNSIKVVWRPPAPLEDHAPIKGYHVSHRRAVQQVMAESAIPLPSSTSSESWLATASIGASSNHSLQTLASDGSQRSYNYEFTLSGLDKNTKYEIRVQPYNSMGVGPPSLTVGQTLKFDRPGQPNLKFLGAKHHSFELKWTINDQEPLMGFSIFYKCEYDDWQEIQLGIIYHYVIDNLRCGNKYQIYLSAFNAVGRSDPSDVLSVRTDGSAPIAPDKSQFFKPNKSEVVLDMSGWQSGGCPINSFMIQFKKLHDGNWYIVSEGATPFASSDKITIPDLTPATWYKLLVTALNEAGSTNAEYLFSTLTLTGEQIAPAFQVDTQTGGATGWRTSGSGSGSIFGALSQLLSVGSTPTASGQDGSHLLLPISCILLLLVTTLTSYLYYSRHSSNGSQSGSTGSATSSSSNGLSSAASSSHQLGSGSRTLGRSFKSTSGHLNYANGIISSSATLGRQPNSTAKLAGNFFEQHNQDQNMAAPTDSSQHQLLIRHLMNNGSRPMDGMEEASTPNGSPLAGSHCMKLLANSAQIFGVTPNSTSVSTRSTNLFENSSSAASTSVISGPSSSGSTKTQLIDESQQQQNLLYRAQSNTNSPVRAQIYAPLGAVAPQRMDFLQSINQTQQESSDGFVGEPCNWPPFNSQECQSSHRLGSVSFQSASELLQRQQRLNCPNRTMDNNSQLEPIYQRLDKFQTLVPNKPVVLGSMQDALLQGTLCPTSGGTINLPETGDLRPKGTTSARQLQVGAGSAPQSQTDCQQVCLADYYYQQPPMATAAAAAAAILNLHQTVASHQNMQQEIIFPNNIN